MNVTYLGTGAAEGIPALFCNCEYCKGVKQRGGVEIRSRAQVIVDGELSIDFPPDAFYHAAVHKAELEKIRYLFVTHSHMDHFSAHEFVLRGYKYAHEVGRLDIYCNQEVAQIFSECTRREMKECVSSLIGVHPLTAFEPVTAGEWRVLPLKAKHSSLEPLVFLFDRGDKRILHLADTGILPEEDYAVLKDYGGKPCDLITLDCTFLYEEADENARHMGLKANKEVVERLKAIRLADKNTKCVITHFSHNSSPSPQKLMKAEREYNVIAAYDGLTLSV